MGPEAFRCLLHKVPFLSLGGNLRDMQPTLLSPREPPPGTLISHGNPSMTPKAWQSVLQVLCNCIMTTCQPLPRFSCPFQGMNLWTGDTRASPGLCCGSSGQQCCVHDALPGGTTAGTVPQTQPWPQPKALGNSFAWELLAI